ncbi:MAG: ribonuclease III [Pseudomonadota bacterium]
MTLSAELNAFQTKLGHRFQDPDLLREALTHGSFNAIARGDNQRLEFLGDRVLGLVMAQALLDADPGAKEGQLAPRYNALVRKEACADVAREIGLGDVLKLGRSEMLSGGRRKNAVLGDAMEALIAAVYLDGGYTGARDLVLRLWAKRIATVDADARDPKTALQEVVQGRGQMPPKYVEVRRDGPDHAPEFTIEVQLASGEAAQAKANSKRQAEQAAAAEMLRVLGK